MPLSPTFCFDYQIDVDITLLPAMCNITRSPGDWTTHKISAVSMTTRKCAVYINTDPSFTMQTWCSVTG